MIPSPPAEVRQAPAPHEIVFEGFNHLALKGTVLPAEGSPFFAVMVADSGPLDRDWGESRLPVHGGRAFAEWLRDQGVGSLRFDKRLKGSRDPKLDTSLDAQSGDVRAALRAARELPEAKGRRLLLVGHGEGAMLGLLAAQDADALLLLAMPGQTMAKTISAQVERQLPGSAAGPGHAYLEGVFQAIREGRGTPVPGPGVHPALGQLATALMAPETLAFVRATLDLDPLAMAARVPVPMALAWGEKDIQTPRPSRLPPGFPGTVLDIPGANHVFKREPLPREELGGPKALDGYRDDRPLADLSLISAWLKALR